MALIEVRVCDRTGEMGAAPVGIVVGDTRWDADLTPAAEKELNDLVGRFLEEGRRQRETADGSDPAPTDDDNPGGGGVKTADLTAEEKQTIRKWARRRPKRYGEVGTVGQLSQAWIDGWVEAGRPTA